MWETILSALISAAAAIIVCAIQSKSNQKVVVYRIDQLEKKVDIHNHVVERTYELEKTTAVLQNDIKVANHRIDDLEKTAK